MKCLPLFAMLIASAVQAQDARAVITTRHGAAVPDKVSAGSVLWLSAKSSVYGGSNSSVLWRVSPRNVAERSEAVVIRESDGSFSPVYVIPVGTSTAAITVDLIVGKADAVDVASVTITVTDGTGPRPPPEPDPPPEPQPDPTPEPVPQNRALCVYVVYEVRTLKPEVANFINSSAWWTGIQSRGHHWAIYTTGTRDETGRWVIKESKSTAPAYLTITDRNPIPADGGGTVRVVNGVRETAPEKKVLQVIPLPASVETIDAAMRKVGGK